MKNLLALALLALLAACTEAPQELHVSGKQVATQDQQQEAARRARTAGQNEGARIYR